MKLLISDIAELQDFLNVYRSFDYQDIKPFVNECTEKYIKKAMSPEMYAELLSNYQASISSTSPVALSDDLKLLWEHAARAIAHLAMYEGASSFNISITQGGATRTESSSTKSAYQYQVEDYKRSRKDQGFKALDDLMEHLDENEDIFTTYKSSNTRNSFKKRFIQDAATFSAYRNIGDSRWMFLLMRPQMDHIAKTRLKTVLTESRFTLIENQLLTGALSAENESLLEDYVRPALAHLSFADAIIDLAISVDDRGITVFNTESARGTVVTYKEAPGNYLYNLRNSELRKGDHYLAELEKKIKELDGVDEDENYTSRIHLSDDDPGFAALT